MASGKPVVMSKLDGIPEEYDQYLIYAKDSSANALADALKQVLDMSEEERGAFGQRAQDFIVCNKNSIVQAQKIVKLIGEIE